MPLRDIQLTLENRSVKELLYTEQCFENIRNVFCGKLGKNWRAGDVSKLIIKLGSRKTPPKAVWSGGFWEICRDDFDLAVFMAASKAEQNEIALRLAEISLIELAEYFHVDPAPVRAAAQATREAGFRHVREYKKASRQHPGNQLMAKVFITYRRGGWGTEAEVRFFDRRKNLLGTESIVKNQLWLTVHFDLWRGAWRDDTFEIVDRVGKTYFKSRMSARLVKTFPEG